MEARDLMCDSLKGSGWVCGSKVIPSTLTESITRGDPKSIKVRRDSLGHGPTIAAKHLINSIFPTNHQGFMTTQSREDALCECEQRSSLRFNPTTPNML